MEDYKKLELSWRIADFLPVSEKLGTITEYIIPEMDADMDGNTSYWNVPEILLGIRWIHEVADNSDITSGGYGEKSRAEYDRTMQKFRILTRLLQSYALRHYIYDQKLQNLRKEKAAFIDFWDEYKQVIRKASKSISLSDAEKEKLVEAASRLLEMADSENDQAAAFRRNLETNNSGIRDSFQKILDNAEKLRQESTEEKQNTLARYLYSFYTRYLFQKEEKEAGSELLSLNQEIRLLLENVGQKSDTPRANKWNSIYRDAIWMNLQQIATQLCMGNQRIIRYQNPGELVTAVTQRMEQAGVAANLIRDYRNQQENEKSRCIAMLDANEHNIRILALSGFLDCDDPELEEYRKNQPGYQDSRKFLEKIQQISRELNRSELAYFSPGVVDQYHCYETGTSNWEPLRKVLQDQGRWGIIGENKACCERKIIAKLESEGKTDHIQSGRLILKFSPCERCDKSLQSWKPYGKIKIVDG